jgi:FkbM family methyltransferase
VGVANAVLERYPQLRRISDTRLVQRCLTLSRSQRLVVERAQFLAGELHGGTRSYALASHPGHRFVVRHRTRDVDILRELFQPPGAYEPPHEAADVLRRISTLRPLRVLDLGANVGLFGVDAFARYPQAEVTSYEPDPGNFPLLARCAGLNPDENWTVVEACVGVADGIVRMAAGNYADSHVSDVGTEVLAVDVLPLLPSFDYVKMDIEGSEWPILTDPRWVEAMREVAAFTLEWHIRGCPSGDPHALAATAVASAGFTVDPGVRGWDHGNAWGWRQE